MRHHSKQMMMHRLMIGHDVLAPGYYIIDLQDDVNSHKVCREVCLPIDNIWLVHFVHMKFLFIIHKHTLLLNPINL